MFTDPCPKCGHLCCETRDVPLHERTTFASQCPDCRLIRMNDAEWDRAERDYLEQEF